MLTLKVNAETWPIAGEFRIAHGTVTDIHVVTVEISGGQHRGRGECRPYPRYQETPESVCAQIETMRPALEAGLTRAALQSAMPAGAARNALDCALWDLEAKQSGRTVSDLAGLPSPKPVTTAFTLSIDTPARMAKAARIAGHFPILKIKIGTENGLACALAVMDARPDAQLIIDGNEAMSPKHLRDMQSRLAGYPVLLIEQPIADKQLEDTPIDPSALPITCADESAHTSGDLKRLWELGYRAVNIKLDKCGGLTEAIEMLAQAKAMGFVTMAGCMVGTSLAIAPMMTLAAQCDVCDLDGAVLLAKDRDYSLALSGAVISPARTQLWG